MLDRENLLEAYIKADKKEKAKIVLRLYILDEEREENTKKEDCRRNADSKRSGVA